MKKKKNKASCLIEKMKAKRSAMTPYFKKIDNIKHSAAITTKRGRLLGIGMNKYHTTLKHGYTTHAEVDTIQKSMLPMYKKFGRSLNKRRITVDITIIRTSLVNSHPCLHCLMAMNNNPVFNVKKVNYSCEGEIITTTLNSLLNKEVHHLSKGNKHRCGLDEEEDEEDDAKCAL